MEFIDFIRNLLGISNDFEVVKIKKDEIRRKEIIYLKYLPKRYQKDNNFYPFYNSSPERIWQYLSWFEYNYFIKCSLPRYVNLEGRVLTMILILHLPTKILLKPKK